MRSIKSIVLKIRYPRHNALSTYFGIVFSLLMKMFKREE